MQSWSTSNTSEASEVSGTADRSTKGTGHTTTDRLITEDVARSLIDGGNTAICLAANAIVTPSAWDLFKQKGIEVIRK